MKTRIVLLFALTLSCSTVFGAGESCSLALRSEGYAENEVRKQILNESGDYLVRRNKDWREKQPDGKDCICCHTTLTLVMQPRLSGAHVQNEIAQMKLGIQKRMDNPKTLPWYEKDEAGRPSTQTEYVLEAVTLIMAEKNYGSSSHDNAYIEKAVWRMLKNQNPEGGWSWLEYNLQPFETSDAKLWGASLALHALAQAPNNFLANHGRDPEVVKLKQWVQSEYRDSNLNGKVMTLLASASIPDLLTAKQKTDLVQELRALLKPDSSWSNKDMVGRNSSADSTGDAYATGFIMYALLKNHIQIPEMENAYRHLMSMSNQGDPISRVRRQSMHGAWQGVSLNKDMPLNQLFASDFATGYARLAIDAYEQRARGESF